jgi:hypothetical protein
MNEFVASPDNPTHPGGRAPDADCCLVANPAASLSAAACVPGLVGAEPRARRRDDPKLRASSSRLPPITSAFVS